MKKVLSLLLCLTMIPLFASCGSNSANTSTDNNTGEVQFGYMWDIITNLPEGFPKISDYVTLASYNSSTNTVHIEWCVASEKMVNTVVKKLEDWSVSHASTETYEEEKTTCYFISKQLNNNVVDTAVYYFPSNTGKYVAESNSWESQLVIEITYNETPTADDTYQLSLTYTADDYTVVHAYKFNGSLCSGLTATIEFKNNKTFTEKKQEITDKYMLAYPSSTVSEYENTLTVTNEQDILTKQLTKADIIVQLQQYGFKQ